MRVRVCVCVCVCVCALLVGLDSTDCLRVFFSFGRWFGVQFHSIGLALISVGLRKCGAFFCAMRSIDGLFGLLRSIWSMVWRAVSWFSVGIDFDWIAQMWGVCVFFRNVFD